MHTARYLDPEHTVFATADNGGKQWVGPATLDNRRYRALVEGDPDTGAMPVPIADYVEPPLSDDDIDAELERRARDNTLEAERARLKPKADDIKRRRDLGERPDITDDAEWNGGAQAAARKP